MYNNTQINDAGYLSSHQSSDNYYNKSENDNAGYLTSHHGKPVCSSVQGREISVHQGSGDPEIGVHQCARPASNCEDKLCSCLLLQLVNIFVF